MNTFFFWLPTCGGTAGSYGNRMFNILRNCQTVSQSVATPFYIPTNNVAMSPFLCQHLYSSVLLSLAILVDVRWCLIVVLNFLMFILRERKRDSMQAERGGEREGDTEFKVDSRP